MNPRLNRPAPALLLTRAGPISAQTNSLGNIILKAAGAVNWRGTARADTEALWAASDTSPQQQLAAQSQQQLQRGWERNTLLSLYFGPSPASLVDPDASFQARPPPLDASPQLQETCLRGCLAHRRLHCAREASAPPPDPLPQPPHALHPPCRA